jgi:hypothetical protein
MNELAAAPESSRPARRCRGLHADERGLSTMEYSVLFVLLLAGAIVAWRTLGEQVALKVRDGSEVMQDRLTLEANAELERTAAPSLQRGEAASSITARSLERSATPRAATSGTKAADSGSKPAAGVLSRAVTSVRNSTVAQFALGSVYGAGAGSSAAGVSAAEPQPLLALFRSGARCRPDRGRCPADNCRRGYRHRWRGGDGGRVGGCSRHAWRQPDGRACWGRRNGSRRSHRHERTRQHCRWRQDHYPRDVDLGECPAIIAPVAGI